MVAKAESGDTIWVKYWPAFLVLGFGSFLRFFRVGDQIILDDEWHALNAVQDHGYGWIFSHLGHADHSIPLTLLYEFFSQTIGLSEITMRAPSLLAGIVAIIALPWLMREWLKPRECVTMAALIAISPFLVNYSRIARPYMLLALLGGAAIIFAWRWWQNNRHIDCFTWIGCTVLAAWLNPVSLAVTVAPFLWFSVEVIGGQQRLSDLRRLCISGMIIALSVSALLFVPVAEDFASLAVKSGIHHVGLGSFSVAATLFTGSGYLAVTVFVLLMASRGLFILYRRDASFSLYMMMIVVAATVAVSLTGAEWINHGIVFARYLIGLLSIFLALAAIGLVQTSSSLARMFSASDSVTNLIIPVLLLALFFAGPLPQADAGNSQFTHHMSKQFDFNTGRNPIRTALVPVSPEIFYHEIAELHPGGDAVIVEAPWYLESNWNALALHQEIHQQKVMVGFVGGTCADKLYGELRQDVDGLAFRNFATLQDVLKQKVKADYLVFRKQFPLGARHIEMVSSKCEKDIRDSLGDPWRSTPSALVFKLRARTRTLSGDS